MYKYILVYRDTDDEIAHIAYSKKEVINYARYDAKNIGRINEVVDFSTACMYLDDRDIDIILGGYDNEKR